jgi:hypothetical protein
MTGPRTSFPEQWKEVKHFFGGLAIRTWWNSGVGSLSSYIAPITTKTLACAAVSRIINVAFDFLRHARPQGLAAA